jgi:recombination protein RecT
MNDVAITNVYDIVTAQEATFSSMISTDEIVWAKESQFAMQALQSNEFLNKTAWTNKASLQNAIINVASIGISLNPANKHAYLVPRDGGICLDISYMGLMHLAQQTGAILWGQAKIVYANDQYENLGLDRAPSHKYNTFASSEERGPIVGAYCTVKTPDGSYLTEEMNLDQINKVKQSSKAFTSGKKCPWTQWEEAMIRKTVVKSGSKYWPKAGSRLNAAIDELNRFEGTDFAGEKDITPERENPHQDLNAILEKRKADPAVFLPWLSKQFGREVSGINQLSNEEASKIVTHMENAA